MYLSTFIALFATAHVALGFSPVAIIERNPSRRTCIVPAAGNSSIDDTPAILKAFNDCGHGGKILFENTTYHINRVMNTTGLEDVEIDLRGTLLVRPHENQKNYFPYTQIPK